MKPNVFIVGAEKSGTTSLYTILAQNQDVASLDIMELNYIGNNKNTNYSIKEYYSYFDHLEEKIRIDATPSYLWKKNAPGIIKKINPESKIIIILRDPVKRMFSAYNHLKRDGFINCSFRSALELESSSEKYNHNLFRFKEASHYKQHIERYLECFSSDNIKIIIFEEMINNWDETIIELCNFLNINRHKFKINHLNKSGKRNFLGSILYNFIYKNNSLRKILSKIIWSQKFKRYLNVKLKMFLDLFVVNNSKESLKITEYNKLIKEFETDIIYLSNLLDKNLQEIWSYK